MADHFEYNYPGPERPERQGDRFKTGLVMGLLGGVVVGFVIGLLAAGHPAFDEQTPILLPMAVVVMVTLVLLLARRGKGRTGTHRGDGPE
jgi:fucose permease